MEMNREEAETLRGFARGEKTWAEVEGFTQEDARKVAEVGCDLAELGRLDEARVLFEGLVELNPKDSGARSALGTVYQKLNWVDEALAAYSAALESDEQNPIALSNRGELRLRAGDGEGLVDLKKACEADPEGRTTAGQRAALLLKVVDQAVARQAVNGEPGKG